MKITLDVTHKFTETVDSSGISSLISYIDLPLYGGVCKNLNWHLYHFVLNLDDEIIAILNQQKNSKFHNLNEDVVFIVKQAHINFGEIKGMDVAMWGIDLLPFSSCFQSWKYNLDDGDEIYNTLGFSTNLPYGGIRLYIVSNSPVTVTFELDECEWFTDYLTLAKRAEQLNKLMDKPLPPKGQQFVPKN